ncbi:MAG: PepSY-like domain-containing protein [Mediterranea sp.]|jgi:hypothetical protein|nr:PepSY-like domain-containing protein [Mediterranea sp.]
MKKIIAFVVMTLVTIPIGLAAQYSDVISQNLQQLPEAAQHFIARHFPNIKPAYVLLDRDMFEKEYEVLLANRTEITFDSRGEWKEVDCKFSAVPDAIVPVHILTYVKNSYPQEFITQIERNRWGVEVELRNDLSFRFNRRGKLVEIDD